MNDPRVVDLLERGDDLPHDLLDDQRVPLDRVGPLEDAPEHNRF